MDPLPSVVNVLPSIGSDVEGIGRGRGSGRGRGKRL